MNYFNYSDKGHLHCEEVSLANLPDMLPNSEHHSKTPVYVYSKNQIADNILSYKNAFQDKQHIIGFSLKANPNPEILKIIYQHNLSIVAVSGFEIKVALDIGFPGKRIFFNGNGKKSWEMRLAIENDCIMNVDSVFNARQLVKCVADSKKKIEVLIRLNVDIKTQVHPYLQTASRNSKFGVTDNDFPEVLDILLQCDLIKIVGLHCHLGSTIDDVTIYTQLFGLLEEIIANHSDTLRDIKIVNVGGGLGIDYHHEAETVTPSVNDLSQALPKNSSFTIMVEPGRSLVGNTGILLTEVMGVKKTSSKIFVVVDGSMTELMRPALYQAYHLILPINKNKQGKIVRADFVGPVCESGDWLGKDRMVNLPSEGDLFAVMDAGAYSMAMASNYNLRARPAEVLIDGNEITLIKTRETYFQVARNNSCSIKIQC